MGVSDPQRSDRKHPFLKLRTDIIENLPKVDRLRELESPRRGRSLRLRLRLRLRAPPIGAPAFRGLRPCVGTRSSSGALGFHAGSTSAHEGTYLCTARGRTNVPSRRGARVSSRNQAGVQQSLWGRGANPHPFAPRSYSGVRTGGPIIMHVTRAHVHAPRA